MAKYYLTTPIYYVNAAPHLGSAYTTIAADVVARWRKSQGDDVFFLTGTAEHGKKMADSAAKAGQTPQDFVDRQSALFQQAWPKLNIEPSDFIRTSESRHKAAVVTFFNTLKQSGKIYEADYQGLYCVGHEAFMKESELNAEGLCPDHKTKPELVKETNWFFKLSAYADFLKEKITSGELQIEPESRRNEVLSFINQGLEDIAISRQNVDWAIPLPWDESQTIYVWLDELFNYCSAIGYENNPEQFQRYWPADLHLVGKDIIKFHCVIWPALLNAIGLPLPKKIFAHGHFTVGGQKMSKTLGNVIDPVELAQGYGADTVRYFLLREVPFGSDGDVSLERFKARYNADLANGLGNLVSRTLNMIEQFWPDFTDSLASTSAAMTLNEDVDRAINNLAFETALTRIWEIISWADGLIEQRKPWELAKQGKTKEMQETLSQVFVALKAVNGSIKPFMPETHQKLEQLLETRPLKKPIEPLFARKD